MQSNLMKQKSLQFAWNVCPRTQLLQLNQLGENLTHMRFQGEKVGEDHWSKIHVYLNRVTDYGAKITWYLQLKKSTKERSIGLWIYECKDIFTYVQTDFTEEKYIIKEMR